jgi:hypothetical protein
MTFTYERGKALDVQDTASQTAKPVRRTALHTSAEREQGRVESALGPCQALPREGEYFGFTLLIWLTALFGDATRYVENATLRASPPVQVQSNF